MTLLGRFAKGATGWKGMSADMERIFEFTMPANYEVYEGGVLMRGDGLGTSTQPMKMTVRLASSGALLGTSQEKSLTANLAESDQVFTFSSPVAGPTTQQQVALGLHTGARSAGGGEVQYSYETVNAALKVANDVYADGTQTVFGPTFTSDNVQATIYAKIRPVTAPVTPPNAPTSFTATPQDGQIALAWTAPTGSYDSVRVVRKAGTTAPASPNDGTQFNVGTSTGFIDTGLTNGQAYSYRLYSIIGTTYSTTGPTQTNKIPVAPPPPETPARGVRQTGVRPTSRRNT